MKSKIGLALLCSDWFLDVGAGGSGQGDTETIKGIAQKDAQTVVDTLSTCAEVIYPGIIFSEEAADAAAKLFLAEEAAGVVLVHLMWSSDGPLIRLLQAIGSIPLLLWCYSPYKTLPDSMEMLDVFRGTGAVGVMQGSAVMRKLGVKFSFAYGACGDEALVKRLHDFTIAAKTLQAMKKLRIGYVGPRCACMTGTWVDEFYLLSRLGPKLIPVSPYRLYELVSALPENELDHYLRWLISKYPAREVPEEALYNAARSTLSVEKAVTADNLDIITVEDLNVELLKLLKARPHLWTQVLSERQTVVSMEADAISALGMWIGQQLSGEPTMYAESYVYDDTENLLLMGHATMHNPALAGDNPVSIIPDREYENTATPGAWLNFTAKPGRVTLLNLFSDNNGFRVFTCKGTVLPCNKHQGGFTTGVIRLDVPIRDYFERAIRLGMTQHNAICYGDIDEPLRMFCEIAGIEYVSC